MSLKLNSSGGGSVTLQEPTTASNVTLNLPAADGTVVYENASGNVGIGTSSPGSKLEISASNPVFTIYNTNTGDNGITWESDAASGASRASLFLNYVNFELRMAAGASGGSYFQSFYTNGSERARIDSSGALLVNTTSATGTVNFSVAADTTTKNPMSVVNTRATAATDFSILFYRAGNIVGSVQTSLSATSYVTSSDYRLKEYIQPMTGALAKVAALKPVTYKWKSDGSNGQGFVAHELAEVVPDAVTGEKDAVNEDGSIKPQGIDTSFLVATLTAAIQELKAEVDSLRAQVEAQ
jgi:hypothetical protein